MEILSESRKNIVECKNCKRILRYERSDIQELKSIVIEDLERLNVGDSVIVCPACKYLLRVECKKSIKEEMIDYILEEFDWEEALKVLDALNIRNCDGYFSGSTCASYTVRELKDLCRGLLDKAYEEHTSVKTVIFSASYYSEDNEEWLTLRIDINDISVVHDIEKGIIEGA